MKNFTRTALLIVSIVLCAGMCITISAQRSADKAAGFVQADCKACQPNGGGSIPDLGTAASFSVLGGSTVTNTGPSLITGNLGVSPGTAVTGFPPGQVVGGMIHSADAIADEAKTHAFQTWGNLAATACDGDLTGTDLGGLTLGPGTYCFDSSAELTGILTLNGAGNPDAVFVFQIGSTLTTASDSSVVLINEARACNVFYQVGSSVTVGVGTSMQGNLIALTSVTLATEATLFGRAIAIDGAVTLDSNGVTICNLAPSAAPLSVSGRVIYSNGRPISGAVVTLIDGNGVSRSVTTSSFGRYRFVDMTAGQTVFLQVAARRHTFLSNSIVITPVDSLTDIDFVAN